MPVTPLKRRGEPEDISAVAVFLASDESSGVTGEIIRVGDAGVVLPKAFTDYTEGDYNLVMNTNVKPHDLQGRDRT
ncbi:MAG TPA: SDR family oxidoreductase [Chthoniobacterales bacterium]|nr:SDR family oxidoreductase [Chthoniobacterales bacterium]